MSDSEGNLNSRSQLQFAIQKRDEGDLDAAHRVLKPLEEELQGSVFYLTVLGGIYWELNSHEDAIEVFKRASHVSPTSEMISLGLFHCLWKSGDTDQAFDEMRRFLLVGYSEEYRTILKEINEAG